MVMSRVKRKRSVENIVDLIYAELERDGAKTPNEIALAIKANFQTVKKWLDLIVAIQGKRKLVVETGKRITLVRLEKP